MSVAITVKPIANTGSKRWVVVATLDEGRPGFARRHFVIETNTDHEALGVAGDLLDAIYCPYGGSKCPKK